MPPALPSTPKRILVRGVNWLGDAVMSTPALLRLRERFPTAHIALLTPEKLRELWRHHPALNEVIAFTPGESVISVARKLRAGGFEIALVLPNSPRSAMEVWLAGIPHRVGHRRPWRGFFLTHAIGERAGNLKMRKRSPAEVQRLTRPGNAPSAPRRAYPATAHHLHDYLQLAAVLGASPELAEPRIEVSRVELESAAIAFGLNDAASGGRPHFGIFPGAEYGPAKRWPEARFIEAADEIRRRANCRWVVFGGPAEAELGRRITGAIQGEAIRPPFAREVSPGYIAHNLSGQTNLRELCAAMKLCRVLLTNDSGPMHLAAAVGTPVVVPFGSTSPELTGPGLPGSARHQLLTADVPCAPCFLRECPIDFRCMNGISVERVVEAVLQAAVADRG